MFDIVPPFVFVLVAAGIAAIAPRRIGHVAGMAGTAFAAVAAVLAPSGVHVTTRLFGFDTILYSVDQFSSLMGLIFGFIGLMAVIYSYYSDAEGIQTAFALTYVGTSVGAVFAGDWLTLVFFWELMAITSTLLVWHYGGRAVRAGFRYALLHGIGGSLVLAAVVWQYVEVGSFLFTEATGIVGTVPAVLAAIGIGVNVGFIGLHAWLPDTYPRPHIAASVFLCVYTTKTGVYAMYRAFPEGHLWIAYMGGAMAVFGAFVALLQHDMRRLLSYHIQSQVGYMVAGVGIGGTLATAGAFGHVFNHILYKSLLFMTVGVVIYRTGQENLKNVGGLARSMPITAITFTIAALSIAGFPGFNGFVSKGMVIGAAHYKHLDALWWLLIIGGVGTFLSFIKLGYHTFFHGSYAGDVKDANRGQQIALVTVAGLCVLYGVYPDALFSILPAGGELDYHTFTVDHIAEGLALAAIAAVAFVFVKDFLESIGHVPDIDSVYNPVVFHATRTIVVGTTETYDSVDRFVVGMTAVVSDSMSHPERVVSRGRDMARPNAEPVENQSNPLQFGIGTGVLLLAGVAVAFLVLALLLG